MKKPLNKKLLNIIKISIPMIFISLALSYFGLQAIKIDKSTSINRSLLIEQAHAVDTGVAIPGGGTSFSNFLAYVNAVFTFSLKLGVALTSLMLIYAGYKYMTSQGNPTAINEAKDIMIGSLSGFIMLLLVYLILNVYNLK